MLSLSAGDRSGGIAGFPDDYDQRVSAILIDLVDGTPLLDTLSGGYTATGVLPAGTYGVTLSGRGEDEPLDTLEASRRVEILVADD